MKVTTFFLFAMFFQVSGTVFSQTSGLINLKAENESLKEILKLIEDQSSNRFLYNSKNINVEQKKSIDCQIKSIEEVLDMLFEGTDIKYRAFEKTYVLFSEESNRLISKRDLSTSTQQQQTISGKITDSSGSPLPGVTVIVKGTTQGTVTNAEGEYSLIDVPEDAVLQFSFVGMKTQDIVLNGKDIINVTMLEDAIGIEEVVAIGYGTMKKSDINAAIVSVKSDELVKTSSPNVSDMLMGKAAGLTVIQRSAQPGGGLNVLIRGAASTGAGNAPLYVIDGFPVSNSGVEPSSGNQWNEGSRSPLNDINPNDIESVEILKDASATAIYGARGSNGVILITTKRGNSGTQVNYTFNTSIQEILQKPVLLNAQEFMIEQNRYLNELYLQQNEIYPYGNTDPSLVSPYLPKYTDEEIATAGVGVNWYDLITRTGKINQHNLAISHGGGKTKTLFSLNYFSQEGVIKTSGIERITLRYNLDQEITKWWNYSVSSLAAITKEENATLGGGRDATAGIIESALNYSPLIKVEKDPFTGGWVEDPSQALLNHPLSYLDMTDNTKTKRFLTTLSTNIYLFEDVWMKFSFGADIRNGLRENYSPLTTKYGREAGGDANINNVYREDYIADAVANYQKEFNLKHKLYALVGYSYQVFNSGSANARAQGFSSDALSYYDLGAGTARPIVSSGQSKHILASYFTRLQYTFDDKYLFTFTGRIDGSDRFGKNNRYAFFPSGAFAWRISKENFMMDASWISDIKFRLSLGQTGNENIGNGAASEYYAFQGLGYYFGDSQSNSLRLSKLGNPDLKWETTTEYNFGVDFGFFKNRINGNVDIFYKEIKDLLSNRTLPLTSVVSTIPWNVGTTQSKGIELMLNTINLTGPLHWKSTLTFTSYRDKWLERDPKVILAPYRSERDPLRSVFTLLPDGIKQIGEETPTMPALLPGQQKYKDINGLDDNGNLTGQPDGVINQADLVYRGTQTPKFTAGFSNTVKYKNFDWNCFIYASVGALKWPTTRMEHSVYGSYGAQRFKDNFNFLKEVENRWNSDNMNATMPSGEVNGYSTFGAPYWEKASYIRLKNLSMGYDISDLIAKRFNYTARVSLNAQNVFTITNYNGLDPEVENTRAAYPQTRTYSIGIDIKF